MPQKVFICSDGHRLSYNIWLPEGKPKAFVQILHGMAEHSARYSDFAGYLNSLGYAVYAQDHRGHGHTARDSERGWFAVDGGWERIALDSIELARHITDQFSPGCTFLLGHSMGSFLARTLIAKYPGFYIGAIIMGSGCSKGLAGKIGKIICRIQIKSHGSKSPGYMMNKMCFASYNKKFSPAITDFDWLSSDVQEVRKYISDPMCGFICTNGFFYDLLCGVEFANNKKNAESIPKDLSILIVSGEKDPVGDMGKGVKRVYSLYKNAGLSDVSLKLFPGMRHEILNETDRQIVYEFIAGWLNSRL